MICDTCWRFVGPPRLDTRKSLLKKGIVGLCLRNEGAQYIFEKDLPVPCEATRKKCQFPNGVTVKPDGVHELDPCIYEELEVIENCTVRLLRCKYCGNEEWEWERNDKKREGD